MRYMMGRSPKSLVAAAFLAAIAGMALLPAGAASGSASSGTAHQGVSAACLRSYDPYAVSKAFLLACHDRIYPLQQVIRLPGGGREYVYDVDGMGIVSMTPPPGFDALTASAARLAEYGYPPRPSGGQALVSWRAMVRNANFGPPASYSYLVSEPAALPPPSVRVNPRNPIWAGNVATGHTYKDVYANWLEPKIHGSTCSSAAESTWVGLGGWGTQTLAQAGTAFGEGSVGVAPHQAWLELIHASTDHFMPIPLRATVGGEFTSEVDRTAHGYHIFVKNDFTGRSKNYSPRFRYYDGSSAEMIVEDPFGGEPQGGPFLANFKTFKVEDAEASLNGLRYHGLAHWPHATAVMVSFDHNRRTMAYPGSAFNSGDSWYDHEVHCS